MRWWWTRDRDEKDLERELSSHLDAETDEQEENGLTPEEAAYSARRTFGNVTAAKENVREVWGWTKLEHVIRDFVYALRILRRSPGFTLTAVLSLALGIGANTAIFTVVNAVLLRPLPFPESDRLVQLWESQPEKGWLRNVVNPINFLDWRDRTRSFDRMSAISGGTANLTGAGDPVALPAMQVSPDFLSVLRISPAIGRSFLPQEGLPGQEHVAIVSFGLWQSRFGSDPKILGRKIIVDGEPTTVVGVMPAGFTLPKNRADIWTPLPIVRSKDWEGGRFLEVIARLKQGISLKQAQEELHAVGRQLAAERPDFDKGWSAEAVPMLADATENVRLPLLVLLAAVGLVLLIACANVANLLLMRAAGRLHEISLRAALGASRGRLLQQLLSESGVLVIVACLIGLGIGYGGVKALLALVPNQSQLPRLDAIHMDGRVFLFAAALSILSALLFGLIPSLQVSQIEPQQTLRLGSARSTVRSSFRKALVVLEVALCLLLLVGAGLMLRSFQKLVSVDPGFATQHVLTMGILTSPVRYQDSRKRADYFANVLAEIRSVPGVEAAGSIHFLPLEERTSGSCFSRFGEPLVASKSPDADFLVVSPGYFETIRTPLLFGRSFNVRDRIDKPSVIMVNAQFVRKFLGQVNPIGQKLNLCWTVKSPAEIVGVVADARQTELQADPKPTIFLDNLQAPMYFAQLTIRTSGDSSQMARAIEAAIHRVNPEQPVTDVQTMQEVFSDSVAQPRLQLVLLLIFGVMAGLLAIIGIYGVVSYSVAQRTREIGIRMALGARSSQVRWTVLKEGIALAVVGVGIGLAGASGLTRILRTMLFETPPNDPLTLACVTVAVLLVALVAAIIPASRAARMDPTVSLRYE
jgi:putative ABC transport system permease protein